MTDLWLALPADVQDALWLAALLCAAPALGLWLTRGYRTRPLTRALLRRHLGANAMFVALIAVSVGLGVALSAQERALRVASARAADGFDLVIAAPGGEIAALMATVYLQPSDIPLLSGETFAAVAADPLIALAAPIAFGDSHDGAPIVGTVAEFVLQLAGPLAEGRLFAAHGEAVIGARSPLALGDRIAPEHGAAPEIAATRALGETPDAHDDAELTVVGRMAPTGSPWDRAILIPIETVFELHGLASGHAPGDTHIGAPFDAASFPGTPAIVVRPHRLADAYQLRARYGSAQTMAFFPATTLAGLHAILGDVRQILSVMALTAEALVAAAVLSALVIVIRLFAEGLELLRAIGAPRRYLFAVVWSYCTALLTLGAGLGLMAGLAATAGLSQVLSRMTDLMIVASVSWPEAHLVAAFVLLGGVFALIPAWTATR
ncbi:MAG: putative ABC transport system permease protein [Paracoccaceae bacterium]|jgi:putative ABC transport system permease protein